MGNGDVFVILINVNASQDIASRTHMERRYEIEKGLRAVKISRS